MRSFDLVLVVVWIVATPARAQPTCTIGAFGHHVPPIDLITAPIGFAECQTPITITVEGTSAGSVRRHLDVWSTNEPSLDCSSAAARRVGFCTPVSLPSDVGFNPSQPVALRVTAPVLFGACHDASLTFWIFDSADVRDDTADFTRAQRCAPIPIAVDVTPPSPPMILGAPSGEGVVAVPYARRENDPIGALRLYVNGAGCAADAGPLSLLVANGTPPSGAPYAFTEHSFGPLTIDVATLGWQPGTYGERVALGLTEVDRGGNESVVSNVVCLEHLAPRTPEGCGCTTVGRRSAVPSTLLGALALVVGATRRSSRSRRDVRVRSRAAPPSAAPHRSARRAR